MKTHFMIVEITDNMYSSMLKNHTIPFIIKSEIPIEAQFLISIPTNKHTIEFLFYLSISIEVDETINPFKLVGDVVFYYGTVEYFIKTNTNLKDINKDLNLLEEKKSNV